MLNARQILRSSHIALFVEITTDCEQTQLTKTSWNIYKFDDDPRGPIPLAGLRKSLFHTEFSTSDILLPARFLSYGFYEIVARVEMIGLPDVFGTASMCVQIVQTPWLEAAVTGGSFHTVPYGFEVGISIQLRIGDIL